jgi:hypothetical protein
MNFQPRAQIRFRKMTLSINLFRLCLLYAGSIAVAAAADIYISPSGNDGNDGSQNWPFRTIAQGVKAAGPGDRIILDDGVYGNEGHLSDSTGGLHGYATPVKISKSGTSNAWITLKAANRWGAVLDCGTTAASLGCDKNIILAAGVQYWSFEDMVFTRGAFGGIGTDAGASNIQVKGCRFENIGIWNNSSTIGEDGLGFDVAATNWRIEGNMFHDIGRTGGVSNLNLDHGVYAAGTNVVVINNVFYNLNKGWSIQIANGANNWLIANNTFAFASNGPGQVVLWKVITNVTVQNNIFYEPIRSAIEEVSAVVNGCNFDHNMVTGASSIVSGLGITTSLSGCGGTNRFGISPEFVNAEQPPYDFHLRTRSPASGAGVPLSSVTVDFDGVPRPQNRPPSVGAYEPSPLPPVRRPPPPKPLGSGVPKVISPGSLRKGAANAADDKGGRPSQNPKPGVCRPSERDLGSCGSFSL